MNHLKKKKTNKQTKLEQPQLIPINLGQHLSNPIGSTYPY
jgi:hypothetical protein